MTRPILILSAAAFSLAACTAPDGSPRPNTATGAAVGGLFGGLLGATTGGNKTENVVIGAAIGATVGGLIGQELDRQAEALRASMSSDGISIVNTGSELVVSLPNDITFASGSSALTPGLRSDLAALARNLNAFPDSTADIIGHTDSTGEAGANQLLSTERAAAVMAVLVSNGVDVNRLRAIGRGESEPKASNLSEAGRAENRRVEIIIRPTS
jgi:outer membrane protein OmpA-like peptidoglycan-associated protein